MATYLYDGQEISHITFVSRGIAAGALPATAPRRCTYWELLNENAQKGHQPSIDYLSHLQKL